MNTHRDDAPGRIGEQCSDVVELAVTVIRQRCFLDQDAAAAALFDMAQETGVQLDDLANLVAQAAEDRGESPITGTGSDRPAAAVSAGSR